MKRSWLCSSASIRTTLEGVTRSGLCSMKPDRRFMWTRGEHRLRNFTAFPGRLCRFSVVSCGQASSDRASAIAAQPHDQWSQCVGVLAMNVPTRM